MSAESASSLPRDVEQQDGEVANGNHNPDFGQESLENAPFKENRVIRKAKRHVKVVSPTEESEVTTEGGVTQALNNNKPQPYSKNSRKSRNCVGRGLPKKGGAGGKGTWGAPGSEASETGETFDSRDPNYDSDSQEDYSMKVVIPQLTDEELEKALEPLLHEYLENGDIGEVLTAILEMNVGQNRYKIVGQALALAMERHDPHRELMSRLVSDMFGDVLLQEDMMKGFDDLLKNLSDLSLDTPEAPSLLGQFIARAVADDCLPPKFVASYKGKMDCPYGKQALDKADVLLSMNHGIVRLDNVWGVGGGNRPVKYLKKQMALLLKEYLSSGDIAEATRCLKELDVPHFHHEVVYEAVTMAIEDSSERACDNIVKFLKYLYSANIVSPDQMSTGMRRVYDEMPEISVDVPNAYTILEQMGNHLHAEGVLSEELAKDLPARGRKRFVSEGDGGRVKDGSDQ